MEMEKRVLLAIFLIAVILVLSNLVLTPPQGPEEGPGQVTGVEKEAEKKESVAPADTAKVEAAPQETAPVLPTKIAHEETIRVETDLYRLGISSRGGRLISMELKGYDSYTGEGGVKLIPPKKSEFMAMRVTLGKDTLDLAGLEFSPSRLRLDASEEQQTLLLSRTVGGTESIELRYDFTPGEYVIGVHVKIPGAAGRSDVLLQTDLLPRLLPTEEDSLKNDIRYFGTVMGGTKRSVENVDVGDLGGSKGESSYKEGPFIWAGVRNKYFVAAIISKGDPIKGVVSRGSKEENRIGLTALMPVSEGGNEYRWSIYFGPQDYYLLSSLGVGMEDICEYGWWIIRPFSRLIVIILLWMHQFISNYGLVIIIFSVLTKVAFFPLTQKSLKATQDLQKIQPLLKDIKEKYKKEPQKLQQETMRLYKEHKVNPLGGCLPMIIQMPVLWALFYVFRMTIEFRGADFGLWIHDLSAPDRPPVLPIIMGLSMFLQQKMSPQSTDPKMAPMTFVMPVILTVVFINFSSGLVLYWTVNNLLAIAQQYYLKKKMIVVPAPAVKKKSPPGNPQD